MLRIQTNGLVVEVPRAVEAEGGDTIAAFVAARVEALETAKSALEKKTVQQLEKLAGEAGIEVDGTGSEGRNLKSDYVDAILLARVAAEEPAVVEAAKVAAVQDETPAEDETE